MPLFQSTHKTEVQLTDSAYEVWALNSLKVYFSRKMDFVSEFQNLAVDIIKYDTEHFARVNIKNK